MNPHATGTTPTIPERIPRPSAIIAHRGASHLAPENTLTAIRLAWKLGSDGVEVDVHLSRDGRLMVIHDETTGRTTGADHAIGSLTAEELQRLNAATYFDASYPFEKIPLLEEVLATVPPGKRMLIEIKDNRPALWEALEANFHASGLSSDQVMLGTFDYDFAVATKHRLPHHDVVWISCHYHNTPASEWENVTSEILDRLRAGGLDGLNTGACHDYNPAEFLPHLQRIQSAGLKLGVWTVDTLEKARPLWELPVDSITTNTPDILLEALAAPSPREKAQKHQ